VPADCYFCNEPKPPAAVDNPIGTLGTSVGACKLCGSFACGHHGSRDINGYGFICVVCTALLVQGSGVQRALGSQLRAMGTAPQNLRVSLATAGLAAAPFASVEDFIERMPAYNGPRLRALVRESELDTRRLKDRSLRDLLATAGIESKGLFVLSGLLGKSLADSSATSDARVLEMASAVKKRVDP
jgi:hypothetical protein